MFCLVFYDKAGLSCTETLWKYEKAQSVFRNFALKPANRTSVTLWCHYETVTLPAQHRPGVQPFMFVAVLILLATQHQAVIVSLSLQSVLVPIWLSAQLIMVLTTSHFPQWWPLLFTFTIEFDQATVDLAVHHSEERLVSQSEERLKDRHKTLCSC